MLGPRDLFVVGLVAAPAATVAPPAVAQTQDSEGLTNVDRRAAGRAHGEIFGLSKAGGLPGHARGRWSWRW